ncbi:MAG: Grx4 family monothiol glutaredoxin [Halothiobacillaceae bacterium]
MDVMDRIHQYVTDNPVLIFMKGTPQFPTCGFSSRTAEAMKACDVPFGYVNVLADPEIFENLPRYKDWPTFPQVYVNGELIGGHDIVMELYQRGELKPILEQAVRQAEDSEQASPK